jgi:hypothetical protein
MVVQPRTLIAVIISAAVLIVSAIVYFIFFRGEKLNDATTLAQVTVDAQIKQTSLYDLAVFANLVRSAYDQKVAAEDDDANSEAAAKIICGHLFKDLDLSLLAQALSVDIEQKIDDVVRQKEVTQNIWNNCPVTCTCSTLATLLDKAIEAGERVLPEALEAAQAAAESLTTADAIRCATLSQNVCETPLARGYAEQAATIE